MIHGIDLFVLTSHLSLFSVPSPNGLILSTDAVSYIWSSIILNVTTFTVLFDVVNWFHRTQRSPSAVSRLTFYRLEQLKENKLKRRSIILFLLGFLINRSGQRFHFGFLENMKAAFPPNCQFYEKRKKKKNISRRIRKKWILISE